MEVVDEWFSTQFVEEKRKKRSGPASATGK
jgi:hypothetical protein